MRISDDSISTTSYMNWEVPIDWVDPNPKPAFKPGEHLPVAFDIDGIVLDTATEMWKVITQHLELPWSIDMWTDYDVGNIVGVPTKNLRSIYEPVLRRRDLVPVPGAAEALNGLYHKYDKPLLFITSRRAQFKYPAAQSIFSILDSDVEFEILCTGDMHEEEFRNDKSDLLKKYKVKGFVEDNWMFWEKYAEAGIKVITLQWPWTNDRAVSFWERGIPIEMRPNWERLHKYIETFLEVDCWRNV
jgi:uncharacterized HAD superfamily protein